MPTRVNSGWSAGGAIRRLVTRVSLVVVIALALGYLDRVVVMADWVAPCWRPPVDAPIRDPFRSPVCPYCAGNRGIEYATGRGTVVRSVAAGRVSFAGDVAGTRYVVVELASGWKITYGNVESSLRTNDVVVADAVIGRTLGPLHFGIRDGGSYLDPTPFLGALLYRARLVPTDGTPGNDPGATTFRCQAAPSTPLR